MDSVSSNMEKTEPTLWSHSFDVPNTGSMRPDFQGGERAIIVPEEFDTVKEGDIVAVESPRNNMRSLMHRVIIKGDDYLITKGDSNKSAEEVPIEKSEYRGKVKKLDDYLKGK